MTTKGVKAMQELQLPHNLNRNQMAVYARAFSQLEFEEKVQVLLFLSARTSKEETLAVINEVKSQIENDV